MTSLRNLIKQSTVDDRYVTRDEFEQIKRTEKLLKEIANKQK